MKNKHLILDIYIAFKNQNVNFDSFSLTLSKQRIMNMMYGAYMMASSWDSQIKADMDRIGWNPFNSNEEVVLKSKYISFYKGSAVIRHSVPKTTSCSIGGVIFLNRNTSSIMDLKHEWGHSVQSWFLGALYIPLIAIPSVINYQRNLEDKLKHDYYWYPWESTADWLGGVVR